MRKHVLTTLAIFTIFTAFTLTSAHAQSERKLTVDIPFDFAVKGKVLRAGTYTFGRVNGGDPATLVIRSLDLRTVLAFATQRGVTDNLSHGSALVFNRYAEI